MGDEGRIESDIVTAQYVQDTTREGGFRSGQLKIMEVVSACRDFRQ